METSLESYSIPTPPDSLRQRRHALRESENVEGEFSIEEYLLRSEPFRTTTQQYPWPYPLSLVPAEQGVVARVEACKAEILQVLSDHEFPTDHHYFWFNVEDVSKPEYPLGAQPQTTLRLVYMEAPFVPQHLGPAKDAIYQLMALRGIRDVDVEIVFLDKCFRPSIFSIARDHPAIEAYSANKIEIVQLVHRTLMSEWSMLSLYKLGLTKRKSSPTIVIFVNPFTVKNWSDLALQIKLLLPANNPVSLQINVEFLPGFLSISSPRPEPTHDRISLAEYMRDDGIPTAGTSITVLPERGGGSLGPFVTLTQPGKTWRGALTNYHVVRPPRVAGDQILENANRFGSSPSSVHPTDYDISFFAPKDIETTTWALEKQIGVGRQRIQQLSKKDRCAKFPAPTMVSELEKKLELVRRMPKRLGRTLVSSGRIIAENKVADWAFIELDSRALNQDANNHKNKMPHIPMAYKPFDPQGIYHDPFVTAEGLTLDGFGSLTAGDWYCKTGRTTHVTSGISNGVSTYCNWNPSDRQRFAKDGTKRALIEDGITEEWVITTENVGPRGTTQGAFCESGDYGAGIIDRDGRICGLLYGGANGLCGHRSDQVSGLCSSMDDVKRWVEEKMSPAILGLPT